MGTKKDTATKGKKSPTAKAQELAAALEAKNAQLEDELIEADLSDLEVELPEETTPKKEKAPKKGSSKKDKQAKGKAQKEEVKPSASDEDGEPLLTTKDVAKMVGTTPKELRRVLRQKWYDDKVTTHYRWAEDDPILQEIIDFYAARKEVKKAQ